MSREAYDERDRVPLGLRLTGVYGRWTVAYLGLVLALWLAGFEGIWESPIPFYAYLKAASPTFSAPAAVLVGLLAACLAVSALESRRGRVSATNVVTLTLTWAALAVLAYAFYWLATAFAPVDPKLKISLGRELLLNALPWLVFIAGLAGLLVALRHLNWFEEEPSPRVTAWMLLALVGFAIAFSSAVAMMRGGVDGITQAYARYGSEYVGDIGITRTIRDLFGQYADKHDYLSMHAKVHPPGPIVLLWIFSIVFTREPFPMSMVTVVVGSLAVIPLYFWAKELVGKRAALTTCLLYVLVPSIVMFTATSADILFMPFLFLTLFLFGRALDRTSILYAVGAGAMYGVLSLLSFSLLSLGAYFAFMGLWRMRDRSRWFGVIQTAVVMVIAFLGLHLAVSVWSGFDVIAVFKLSKAQFDTDQANLDIYTPRYASWVWRLLNPLAWAYFAGIPVTWLFLRRVTRPDSDSKALCIVFALTLLALNFLYLGRGEGERSAMYVFPFLILPAAHLLNRLMEERRTLGPLVATLAFLAFQCWFTEAFFYTFW